MCKDCVVFGWGACVLVCLCACVLVCLCACVLVCLCACVLVCLHPLHPSFVIAAYEILVKERMKSYERHLPPTSIHPPPKKKGVTLSKTLKKDTPHYSLAQL